MSHPKKSAVSYKQLQQENKILGNIITALKSNKNELEEENQKLQHHVDQISQQQTRISSENESLRNITAELQSKLHSFCDKETKKPLQPPQLQTAQTNINNINNNKDKNKSELLVFLQNTSDRINNIESSLSQKPISIKSIIKSRTNIESDENHIHCLKQEIHKLEMEKIDLLKYNQQCLTQLQDVVNDQQSFQQKICYLENENMRLRQHLIENNPSFIKCTNLKELENNKSLSQNLSNLSFEGIIDEVKRIEQENKCQQDLKQQIFVLNDENNKIKEQLIEKQNENESLFDKYNMLLDQYQVLCKQYLK